MRQFQIAPGCRVDLYGTGFGLFLRGAEQGQLAALRDCEVFYYRAHGRDFRAGEAAECLKRRDIKQVADPLFRAGAVKGRAGQARQRNPEIRDDFVQFTLFRL